MSSNTKNKSDTRKKDEKKDRKLVIALTIALAVVVVVLVAVIIILLGQKKAVHETSDRVVGGTARTVVDDESAAGVMDQMRQEVEEGMFQCEMSMKWTFDNWKAESLDAYVANSVNNSHPIYFDVYIDGIDEPVYMSPVLPVGTNITNIKLNKELDAGTYEATVMYTLLEDIETQEEMSRAGFVIQIEILN